MVKMVLQKFKKTLTHMDTASSEVSWTERFEKRTTLNYCHKTDCKCTFSLFTRVTEACDKSVSEYGDIEEFSVHMECFETPHVTPLYTYIFYISTLHGSIYN